METDFLKDGMIHNRKGMELNFQYFKIEDRSIRRTLTLNSLSHRLMFNLFYILIVLMLSTILNAIFGVPILKRGTNEHKRLFLKIKSKNVFFSQNKLN